MKLCASLIFGSNENEVHNHTAMTKNKNASKVCSEGEGERRAKQSEVQRDREEVLHAGEIDTMFVFEHSNGHFLTPLNRRGLVVSSAFICLFNFFSVCVSASERSLRCVPCISCRFLRTANCRRRCCNTQKNAYIFSLSRPFMRHKCFDLLCRLDSSLSRSVFTCTRD